MQNVPEIENDYLDTRYLVLYCITAVSLLMIARLLSIRHVNVVEKKAAESKNSISTLAAALSELMTYSGAISNDRKFDELIATIKELKLSVDEMKSKLCLLHLSSVHGAQESAKLS